MIDPVRPIALGDIEAARVRIAATVLRTPLVKLDLGSGDILIEVFLQHVVAGNLVLLAAFSCRRTRRACLA